MAPKDKAVELTAESSSSKKNNNKKKNGTDSADIIKLDDAMSDEDRDLKERLETCVQTILESAATEGTAKSDMISSSGSITLKEQALQMITTELRTATASMTSVPKPLKFLRPHYAALNAYYYNDDANQSMSSMGTADEQQQALQFRAKFADVMAVLAMTMGTPDARECLKFKLAAMKDYEALQSLVSTTASVAVDDDPFGIWGHEFVRTLSGEIGTEYNDRVIQHNKNPDNDDDFKDLLYMISYIIPFHIQHNAEAEAIDLLMEVQRLKLLLTLSSTSVVAVADDAGNGATKTVEPLKKVVVVDENNYERICLYLIKAADYMSDPDDLAEMLETAHGIYITTKTVL